MSKFKSNYKTKYKTITVIVNDNNEQIIEDLETWVPRLYRIPNIGTIAYRGLLRFNYIEDLSLLKSVSPYGAAYEVYDEETLTYKEHEQLMSKIGKRRPK